MQKKSQKQLLTMRQACSLLNVHANTLRNWEKQGLVEVFRIGTRRDRRFSKQSLQMLVTGSPESKFTQSSR